jgi:AhpD family alkylhydroperoxidase
MSLDERTEELIAIGASVTANCLGCVEFHMAKARNCGADDEEIQEALRVGKLVRRGSGNKFDKFAEGLLKGDGPVSTSCGGACA